MISNVTPHQISHLPFRPSCLNDESVRVPRKRNNGKWRISQVLARLAPPTTEASPERKSLRTFMFDACGKLQDAKIDLRTGEVAQYSYKRPEPMLKARPKQCMLDVLPFWMIALPDPQPATGSASNTGLITPDKSRRKQANRLKPILEYYVKIEEAIEDYPVLDNVLTGGAELSLGENTRPLNKKRLFHMLQQLDVITPLAVRDCMGYSKSHSEKVAAVLCVIETGFARLFQHGRVVNSSLT